MIQFDRDMTDGAQPRWSEKEAAQDMLHPGVVPMVTAAHQKWVPSGKTLDMPGPVNTALRDSMASLLARPELVTEQDVKRFVMLLTDGSTRVGRSSRRRVASAGHGEGETHETMAYRIAARLSEPENVFYTLFEPAARIIDELWRNDRCDFLQVTIAISRLQRLVRDFERRFPPQRPPMFIKSILLAPAPGEQHNFGIALAGEHFRRCGWTVDYKAETTADELVEKVERGGARLIGLSLSCRILTDKLAAVIDRIRALPTGTPVTVFLGGNLVADDPGLARDIGADYAVHDVQSAIAYADSLVHRGLEVHADSH